MPDSRGPSPRLLWLIIGLMASVMLTMLAALANYAWQDVRVDASTALDNSIENRERGGLVEKDVKHLAEGQEKIREGQQVIIDTLFVRPSDRRKTEKPVVTEP